MIPLQVNATLTQIAGGGGTEDGGGSIAPGADTTKWTGSSPCFVGDRRRAVTGEHGFTVVEQTVVGIDGQLPAPEIGDVITYIYNGTSTARAVDDVQDVTSDMLVVNRELTLEAA